MTTNKINAETMRKAYEENYETFLKKMQTTEARLKNR